MHASEQREAAVAGREPAGAPAVGIEQGGLRCREAALRRPEEEEVTRALARGWSEGGFRGEEVELAAVEEGDVRATVTDGRP
jgi:hypothetical protein